MPSFPFITVDVFTDRRFGGNQLERITRTPNAANHLPGVRAMNHKSKKTLLSA